jgi:hypothetical protein
MYVRKGLSVGVDCIDCIQKRYLRHIKIFLIEVSCTKRSGVRKVVMSLETTCNASPGPKHVESISQNKGSKSEILLHCTLLLPLLPTLVCNGLSNNLKATLDSLVLALDKLAQPLLHDLAALVGVPNVVRRLVNDVP